MKHAATACKTGPGRVRQLLMAPSRKRTIYSLLVAAVALVLLLSFTRSAASLSLPHSLLTLNALRAPTPSHGRRAFCVVLNEPDERHEGQEDRYFTGTRMLIYQLLHDPVTRTNTSIEFVVLVAPDVPAVKRERLRRDGATVLEVEEIQIDWIKPRRQRWSHVMNKLRAWQLTQYDKMLLFDGDTVVVRRLDALFDEHEPRPSGRNQSLARPDEAPQPPSYLFAGNSGPSSPKHAYPAARGNRFNAGFVLFKPDRAMFDFYLSIARLERRFDPNSPEQNLWNYAHNRKGNMPWIQIAPDWTLNNPNIEDYNNGVASFHEKYWGCEHDQAMKQILLRSRWKMEGYFGAYDP